jgi:thiol-disulfide isomerase/thioredoxin
MPSFSDQFSSAIPYEQYLATDTEEQQRRWTQVYDIPRLDAAQEQLLTDFEREMKILVHGGICCGDCVEQCPLLQRIAEANPAKIDLRFLEREMNTEFSEEERVQLMLRLTPRLRKKHKD